LNVPVVERGRVVAVFLLHDREPRGWRPDKLVFVGELAERTCAAVERYRAEFRLSESDEQFRIFARAVPNHVCVAGCARRLDWFNEQVLIYRGRTKAGRDGAQWTSVVHPDALPHAGRAWEASPSSGAGYETLFRIRDTMRRRDASDGRHLSGSIQTISMPRSYA